MFRGWLSMSWSLFSKLYLMRSAAVTCRRGPVLRSSGAEVGTYKWRNYVLWSRFLVLVCPVLSCPVLSLLCLTCSSVSWTGPPRPVGKCPRAAAAWSAACRVQRRLGEWDGLTARVVFVCLPMNGPATGEWEGKVRDQKYVQGRFLELLKK